MPSRLGYNSKLHLLLYRKSDIIKQMLDVKFVKENREIVEKALAKKAYNFDLDHLFRIDEERLRLIRVVDELRQRRNEAAKNRDIEAGQEIKMQLEKEEMALSAVEEQFRAELFKIPNLPLEGVPEGDETHNQVIKKEGEPKQFDFEPADHVALGAAKDIIDIPRGAKVSGSRFAFLKGDGVLLELALVHYAMDRLMKEGFTPIVPPALIKQEITQGLGYWQGGGNENYYYVQDHDEEDQGKDLNLYLIGTGEHSVAPMHSGEIFEEKELPKRYVAFSPCYRREAGSYGKDTHGILRVHQFDKVEMVSFVKPEDDAAERSKILALAESLVRQLELPYQTVRLASGDLSFPAAETIDIETWIPSQGKYRETHSISTTTDFQARRLGIKYRVGGETKFVHILNGTALAIGRIIIAILENYQTKDGSIEVPKVLREYLGKDSL